MAITAPLSRYKKNNIKLYVAFCLGFAIWCAYDGYYNGKWIREHTNTDGTPQTYLVFNRNAPMYLGGAVVLLGAYFLAIKNKKVVAENGELIIDDKEKIAYDSIQKIDKTNFKSKGFFVIIYKDQSGGEIERKISDRTYDDLDAILNEVVTKIS